MADDIQASSELPSAITGALQTSIAAHDQETRLSQEKDPCTYGDLIGGDASLVNQKDNHQKGAPKGVFSLNPASTPKYRTDIARATESMARILIPFSSAAARNRFVRRLPAGDARILGDALAVSDKTAKSRTGAGTGYIDFLLQNVQETYQEKVQVTDVLSDNYVAYFFGQEPPMFTYQGTLLNTRQDDWRSAFSIIYSELLRGTKLARRRRLMTLTYDNVAVTGTIVAMSQNLTADMEMAASFTFQMLVKRYDVYRLPGTVFNPPTTFTNVLGKVVDPNTFTGLKLGRIKRTYRTVGEPQIAISTPKKKKGVVTRTDAIPSKRQEEENQASENIMGYVDPNETDPNASNPLIDDECGVDTEQSCTPTG